MTTFPVSGSTDPRRLAFLDALRGIAASLVVLEHGFARWIPGYLDLSLRYFDVGQVGVTLFMLISGFVIPVSLERGGSNINFWINRCFRLLPLYWATIAFFFLHSRLIPAGTPHLDEPWVWLANLTMLQDVFRCPHICGVFWTLTLELAFYVSCSLLYQIGYLARTALLVGIGQIALFVLAVCYPLYSDRRFPGGYAFLFLSMFVGTLFYRLSKQQVSRRSVLLQMATLAPLSLTVSYATFSLFKRNGPPLAYSCVWAVWVSSYLFFSVSQSWRNRPLPSWLCYLGRISYSIYLTHMWVGVLLPDQWSPMVSLPLFFTGTLILSFLTFHAIEKPFMNMGKRLLRTREVAASAISKRAA